MLCLTSLLPMRLNVPETDHLFSPEGFKSAFGLTRQTANGQDNKTDEGRDSGFGYLF